MIIKNLTKREVNFSLLDMGKKKGKKTFPVKEVYIKNINSSLKTFGNYTLAKLTVEEYNSIINDIDREIANA